MEPPAHTGGLQPRAQQLRIRVMRRDLGRKHREDRHGHEYRQSDRIPRIPEKSEHGAMAKTSSTSFY